MSRQRRKSSERSPESAAAAARRREHNLHQRLRREGWDGLIADYPSRFGRMIFYTDEDVLAIVTAGSSDGANNPDT
jgi:hypothetical protein